MAMNPAVIDSICSELFSNAKLSLSRLQELLLKTTAVSIPVTNFDNSETMRLCALSHQIVAQIFRGFMTQEPVSRVRTASGDGSAKIKNMSRVTTSSGVRSHTQPGNGTPVSMEVKFTAPRILANAPTAVAAAATRTMENSLSALAVSTKTNHSTKPEIPEPALPVINILPEMQASVEENRATPASPSRHSTSTSSAIDLSDSESELSEDFEDDEPQEIENKTTSAPKLPDTPVAPPNATETINSQTGSLVSEFKSSDEEPEKSEDIQDIFKKFDNKPSPTPNPPLDINQNPIPTDKDPSTKLSAVSAPNNDNDSDSSSKFSDDSDALARIPTAFLRQTQVHDDSLPLHKNKNALKRLGVQPLEIDQKGRCWASMSMGYSPEMSFWQIYDEDTDSALKALGRTLNRHYKKLVEPPEPSFYEEIVVGGIVATKYSLDERFYRALVVDINDKPLKYRETIKSGNGKEVDYVAKETCEKSYLMWYIDYGNFEEVHPGHPNFTKHIMYPLDKQFQKEPALCVPLKLGQFKSLEKPPNKQSLFKICPQFTEICTKDLGAGSQWMNLKILQSKSPGTKVSPVNEDGEICFLTVYFGEAEKVDVIKEALERRILKKKEDPQFEENKSGWSPEYGDSLDEYFEDIRYQNRTKRLKKLQDNVRNVVSKSYVRDAEEEELRQGTEAKKRHDEKRESRKKPAHSTEFNVSEWLKSTQTPLVSAGEDRAEQSSTKQRLGRHRQ